MYEFQPIRTERCLFVFHCVEKLNFVSQFEGTDYEFQPIRRELVYLKVIIDQSEWSIRANIGVFFSFKVDNLICLKINIVSQSNKAAYCISSAIQKHRLYVSANMKIPLSLIFKIFLKYFGKYIMSKTTVKSGSVFNSILGKLLVFF